MSSFQMKKVVNDNSRNNGTFAFADPRYFGFFFFNGLEMRFITPVVTVDAHYFSPILNILFAPTRLSRLTVAYGVMG